MLGHPVRCVGAFKAKCSLDRLIFVRPKGLEGNPKKSFCDRLSERVENRMLSTDRSGFMVIRRK